MEGPRNIKNRSTVRPSNPPSGYLSKGNENKNSERYVHSHVHRSVIYNYQDMEATYVSVDEWIKNKCGMYVYVESKKNNPNSQIQRTDWWPAGGRRRLRREEGGQRRKLAALKSVLPVNVQHGNCGRYHSIYLKVVKRVNHKSSRHRKKTVCGDGC